MEYRLFGQTGVRVSPLCLGAMNFGGAASEADSIPIIHAALAAEHRRQPARRDRRVLRGRPEAVIRSRFLIRSETEHWTLSRCAPRPSGGVLTG